MPTAKDVCETVVRWWTETKHEPCPFTARELFETDPHGELRTMFNLYHTAKSTGYVAPGDSPYPDDPPENPQPGDLWKWSVWDGKEWKPFGPQEGD